MSNSVFIIATHQERAQIKCINMTAYDSQENAEQAFGIISDYCCGKLVSIPYEAQDGAREVLHGRQYIYVVCEITEKMINDKPGATIHSPLKAFQCEQQAKEYRDSLEPRTESSQPGIVNKITFSVRAVQVKDATINNITIISLSYLDEGTHRAYHNYEDALVAQEAMKSEVTCRIAAYEVQFAGKKPGVGQQIDSIQVLFKKTKNNSKNCPEPLRAYIDQKRAEEDLVLLRKFEMTEYTFELLDVQVHRLTDSEK